MFESTVLPFWISISLLSLFQGALVAAPAALTAPSLRRLASPRWALIPPASVIVFVFGARAAERASAESLTYLALVAVPLLAALALGWLARGARPKRALLVIPVFLLAWVDRNGLAGEGAALLLSALSCVSLGVLIATVTPPRWLAAGIVAMALADTTLVVSDLLQRPNDVLNAAHPAAGLPRLQSAIFGSAVMGYGDLFVAAVLGGLLAASSTRSRQMRTAQLVVVIALGLDLLFLAIDELPATVPVALALIVILARGRHPQGSQSGVLRGRSATAPVSAPPGSPRAPERPRRSRTRAEL